MIQSIIERAKERFNTQFCDEEHSTWKFPTDLEAVNKFLETEIRAAVREAKNEILDYLIDHDQTFDSGNITVNARLLKEFLDAKN